MTASFGTASPASPFSDSHARYGLVARALHWSMVLLFGWQYLGMILRELLGKTPLVSFLVGTHATIGALILVLALVRILWALANHSHRPPHAPGLVGRAAQLGHLALYGLMVVVPALALLRLYGSGRGFSPFGIEVFAAGGDKVEWMMAPANVLHGALAWVLLVAIAGHVAMVFVHHVLWRDDTLYRMAGRADGRAAVS